MNVSTDFVRVVKIINNKERKMSNLGWIIIIAIGAAVAVIEKICDTYKETHKKDRDE